MRIFRWCYRFALMVGVGVSVDSWTHRTVPGFAICWFMLFLWNLAEPDQLGYRDDESVSKSTAHFAQSPAPVNRSTGLVKVRGWLEAHR